jgi:hypothetical protein
MVKIQRRMLALIVLVAVGATASTANAGPFGWLFPSESQPNSYSPARYWTPGPAKFSDDIHGPRIDVYAPNRHPEIAPTYSNLKFPCPSADPAATLIERPSPPVTSKFRY